MPKVSIIMSSLNSITYLQECMESVIHQSLKDIEIIPVDAGSTDGTWEMILKYAANDSRIKPLRSAVKSVGVQNNMGIDVATGDYIGFVETDDHIALDMFKVLYEKIQESSVDWVRADYDNFIEVDGERLYIKEWQIPRGYRNLYDQIICPAEHRNHILFSKSFMWNGIYRRSFLMAHDIRFNETPGAAFQDIGFTTLAIMMAGSAQYITQSLYRYRRNNASSSIYSRHAAQFIVDEYNYVMQYIGRHKKQGEAWRPNLYYYFFYDFNEHLKICADFPECPPDIRKTLEIASDSVRKSKEILGESRYTWIMPFEFLHEYTLLNDIDGFYKQRHMEKEAMMHQLREGLTLFRAFHQLIIFGAKDWGARFYILLRRMGIKNVACFCDNQSELWGTTLYGVPIYSLPETMVRYPDTVYVVASSRYSDEITELLKNENIDHKRIYNVRAYLPNVQVAMGINYG